MMREAFGRRSRVGTVVGTVFGGAGAAGVAARSASAACPPQAGKEHETTRKINKTARRLT
jgi:hypothetical protein